MVEIEDLALFRSSTAASGIPYVPWCNHGLEGDWIFPLSLEVEMEDKKASLALVQNSGSDGISITWG